MSHSLEALTAGMDADFQQIIAQLQGMFAHAAGKVHGRPTHTYGVGARGEARIVVPIEFPENDFFIPGKTYPVLLRHSTPGGRSDNRARDGASASVKFCDEQADPSAQGLQNILMNTARSLFVRTARTFFKLVTTPNEERVEKLLEPKILDDAILAEAFRSGGSFTEYYFHSQICYELTDRSGAMSYLRFRLVPGDRGPERGQLPTSWQPKGVTCFPPFEGDPRSESYLRQDFLSRFQYGGIRYFLQGQLRPGNDKDAVDCTQVWDPERYPWTDLAEIHLTEALTPDELDVLAFDVNWTHPCIALPLATSGLWEGLQADNPASLGHARALVYQAARKARAESSLPHAS
ncbi:MAG: hypothetical protein QOE70_4446 [Chthoniobacter sp.]|jgi:hypothetical protein|nr:hypothetical protein [Chthoniobacter sp.]